MDVIFKDDALKELYETGAIKDRRYKKLARDKKFIRSYIQAVDIMLSAKDTSELTIYSHLHYEKLRHRSESSIRIQNNRVERLLFTEHDGGVEVQLIEIDSSHYGNKR